MKFAQTRWYRLAAPLVTCLALISTPSLATQPAMPVGDPGGLAADKLAIIELASRFENTFDAGDVEGHLSTWVDDLTFESPFGNYKGKEAYRGWVTAFLEQASASGGTRHLVTNHEITVSGDTARMYAYLIILSQTGPSIGFTTVFTDDRLVKVDGAWKFTHRTLEVDQPVPTQDQQ